MLNSKIWWGVSFDRSHVLVVGLPVGNHVSFGSTMGFPWFPKTEGTPPTPRGLYLIFSPFWLESNSTENAERGTCPGGSPRWLSLTLLILTWCVAIPKPLIAWAETLWFGAKAMGYFLQSIYFFLEVRLLTKDQLETSPRIQRSWDHFGIYLSPIWTICTQKWPASRLPCACAGRDPAGTIQAKRRREAEWSLTIIQEKDGKG